MPFAYSFELAIDRLPHRHIEGNAKSCALVSGMSADRSGSKHAAEAEPAAVEFAQREGIGIAVPRSSAAPSPAQTETLLTKQEENGDDKIRGARIMPQ